MIVLYSTNCPKSRILKQKMDEKSIVYTEEHSVDKMIGMGITQVPVLSVDGELLAFGRAVEWVNQYQSTKEVSAQ